MANPQDELDALRQQVAALTARVHRLEQGAGLEPKIETPSVQSSVERPAAPMQAPPPPGSARPPIPPPSAASIQPPNMQRPVTPSAPSRPRSIQTGDLEGTIGRLWFNRIGIFALLAGATYF